MACTIYSPEEVKNRILNKEMITALRNPSQADIVETADHIHNMFALQLQRGAEPVGRRDDLMRYTMLDFNDVFLGGRVTHTATLRFEKDKTDEVLDEIQRKSGAKTKGGTFIHETAQRIGEAYYAQIEGKTPKYTLEEVKKQATTKNAEGFSLSILQYQRLESGIKDIVNEIYDKQGEINKRLGTDGKVEIRFELLIVDSPRNMAGTMDIVAFFSDGTGMIYDFKTITPRGGAIDRSGNITRDVIYPNKKEEWKLQQADYKRILRDRYGVDVLGTRIVPIVTQYKYNSKEDKYENEITDLKIGADTSEFLKKVMATYEKVGISELDEFLARKYKAIERLKRLAKKNKERRQEYKNRIQRIEDSIYEFIMEKDIDLMVQDSVKLAIELHDKIKDADKISTDELMEAINELKVLADFIRDFERGVVPLEGKDEKFVKKVGERLKTKEVAKQLYNVNAVIGEAEEVLKARMMDEAGTQTDSQGRVILKEDGYFTRLFDQVSSWSNPYVRKFKENVDFAIEKTRQDLQRIYKEIDDKDNAVRNWLSERGEGQKELIKYLVDPKTDNMHKRVTGEFYDLRNKARNKGDFQFFLDNYEVAEKEKYDKWYKEKLLEQRKYYEEYRFSHLDGAAKEKAVKSSMLDWVTKNNLSLDDKGVPISPQAWLTNSYWLQQKESSKLKYETPEYKFIRENEPLRNFYEMIVELNKEFREILGVDYYQLQNTFLPNVRADIIEKLQKFDFKGIGADIRQMMGIRQDTTMFGMINEATGEVEKSIPIFFLNPFKDAEGNVITGEKTYDFRESLVLFGKMAFNYKHMQAIEANTLALKDMINSHTYFYKENTFGKKTTDFMGNLALTKGSETKTAEIFDKFVDYYLYGIRTDTPGKSVSWTTTGGKKYTINSTQALLAAKNYFSLKALGLGFIPAGASFIAATTQASVEARKGILYDQNQWRAAAKSAYTDIKKYNAIGYFFGIHSGRPEEYLEGMKVGDPLIKGDRVRKYVNSRTLMRPFSIGDEVLDNQIANAMARNFYWDGENLRRFRGKWNKETKSWENKEGESLYDIIEYNEETGEVSLKGLNQEQTTKAIVQFKRAVRDGQQGIKGTMTEEDINHAQIGLVTNILMHFKTWMPGILRERFAKLNYNANIDAARFGRYRALTDYFKQHGLKKYQYDNGTAVEGMTFWNMAKVAFGDLALGLFKLKRAQTNEVTAKLHFEKWKLNNPDVDSRMTYEEYKEIVDAQVNATIGEVRVLALVLVLMLVLGHDYDDDDVPLYKEFWATHKLYQMLSRTSTEIGFASPFNPNGVFEFERLVRSPIPLTKLVSDVYRALGNFGDESIDAITGRKDNRDKTGWFYYTMGLTPGAYQLRRLFNLYEQDQQATR